MLKRLELVGFKSFADKTQFDFAPGITALVGPNGSGKSNVVDAVRWILGEQSAKSLRGGEMADVIFNGSTTRRSLGLAEVTMTFDNTRKSLNTEAEEVQITRRVYRSGEGEYLINQQPSRLKDIKDLLLGSGAGSSAYCIIQQGQVDALLQASTQDRRIIFEEAAGISRFKAKKLETLRRLERVDQNLQRLKDIIDEVDKQLRSVKLQAAKAQRYQEYSLRLKELRVELGLDDFHQLAEQLGVEQEAFDALRAELARRSAEVGSGEADARRLDEELRQFEDAIRHEEARQAQAKQQIAAEETTLAHERGLSADLEAELARSRSRVTELRARVAALTEAAAAALAEFAAGDRLCQEQRTAVRRLDDSLQTAIVRLAVLHRQIQTDKNEHIELMRQAARLQNDATSCQTQTDNLRRERERLRSRAAQAEECLATLDQDLRTLTDADETLQLRQSNARETLADLIQERDRLRLQGETAAAECGDRRAQRSGLASRIEVLDKLERSQEGLGAGARELLALLEGSWGRDLVPGLVADFLTVRREYAPLIDLLLGDRASFFLVKDADRLAQALRQREQPFGSRVGFLPVQAARTLAPLPDFGLEVIRAVDLVTCDHADLSGLAAQLLGNALVVSDLAAAQAIRAQAAGWRCITLRAELLEADGTLTVGTHHAEAGLLSRKSELRELRQEAVALDGRIAETERTVAELRDLLAAQDARIGNLQETVAGLNEQSADFRSRISQQRERRAGLQEEVVLSRSEIGGIDREIQVLESALGLTRGQAEQIEQRVAAVQARLEQADREVADRDQERQDQQQENTAAKVTLAQLEERLRGLRAQQQQIEGDLAQRQQERATGERQLAAARARLEESQQTMLRASSALAWWYLEKESAGRQIAELIGRRDEHRQRRQTLAEELKAAQGVWRDLQERAHARELAVSDLRHRRDSIADRLREDYQIDLAQLHEQKRGQLHDSQELKTWDPQAAQQEVEDLKRKLSRLGSVNLEALQELTELEQRARTQQAQYDDLIQAQKSLQEIIGKINQDSRKLFADTFTAIRGHFQELFRKLFGGGMADIVLEDENDILESGIEIVARPPGKELRSISLLSGGEKTMTAVAMLLAIFRSKPGPFCILDEVDAALDEANIDRFTAVLREFLDRSHFVLVTHSKKTMAMADVLYGITMQESGISKRVAVRLEDFPDEEPQPAAAAERNGH